MPFHSQQSNESDHSGRNRHPAERGSGRPSNKRVLLGCIKVGIGVLVVAGLCWLVWEWINDTGTVSRESPKTTMIIPLPPPPPPPPEPEKLPEPEPEEPEPVEPEPEPDPVPVEEPIPEDQEPSPADDQSEAMQIDGDAQAGADSFNIAAGSGRGMSGSGAGRAGNATYGQYMAHSFQRLLRESEATRHLSFRIQVNVWLNELGQITRAELLNTNGDIDVGEKVLAVIRNAPAMQPPPKSQTLPIRVSMQGRRPGQ